MSGRFCNHTLHLMMFKLFRNKSNRVKIIDRVFMHQRNKWNHCEKILTEKPKTIFIGWFDETIAELENFITRHNVSLISVLNARTIHKSQAEGSGLIFIEHNPMKSKEEAVFEELGLKEVIILTALDEPLLIKVGSEKLIEMIQSLGINEDEIIEHKMVGQSIANAQEKIEKKVVVEQSVRSQAEWMERNFKGVEK